MSYDTHKELSRDTPVRCAVITVSDTRTEENDSSGNYIRDTLGLQGHEVSSYGIVSDGPADIKQAIMDIAPQVEVIILNGGTGISKRDSTVDVVERMFAKRLPGFGELFRMLSYEEIGPGAMLSRATAGVIDDTLVFSTPGSTNAVRLAMKKLIVPELNHLVWELVRQLRQ